MHDLQKVLQTDPKNGFEVVPDEDNIYRWQVFLTFEMDSQIFQDMLLYEDETKRNKVCIEILFPSTYPNEPPFMRIVYPRFHQYTGHITIGVFFSHYYYDWGGEEA